MRCLAEPVTVMVWSPRFPFTKNQPPMTVEIIKATAIAKPGIDVIERSPFILSFNLLSQTKTGCARYTLSRPVTTVFTSKAAWVNHTSEERQRQRELDATGSPRGASRWLLPVCNESRTLDATGSARGGFTLAARNFSPRI